MLLLVVTNSVFSWTTTKMKVFVDDKKLIFVIKTMTTVRWVMSYGFCSKFHTLSNSAKILKIV